MSGRATWLLGLAHALFWLALLSPAPAHAWLLHEHSATAHLGLAQLTPEARARLAAAWSWARQSAPRFCEVPDASGEKLYNIVQSGDFCVSLPVLTGLAADHSCSPTDTLHTVASGFVLDVLKEAETVETELRKAVVDNDVKHQTDVWHLHHINLQIADPQYVSRAEESGAHFQLPRSSGETLPAYLERVLADGAATNAIALYVNYHAAALGLAHRATHGCRFAEGKLTCSNEPAAPETSELFAQAVAAEAFALHFLQDAFSAGHNTTPVGSRAERMGTHDHYCEHGVAAQTWSGYEYLAHGDAFMTPADTSRVATAVAKSLDQFATALTNGWSRPVPPEAVVERVSFDACVQPKVPPQLRALASSDVTAPLADVPRPAVDPPGLEQFSKELGVFYAPVLGAALRVGFEDFAGDARDDLGSFARLPLGTYVGLGLGLTFEGITDGGTDGVVSAGGALFVDGRPAGSKSGLRLGGAVTWHLPYYILPGDLLLGLLFVLPVDALTDGNAFLQMARQSAAGGALGWQRKVAVGPRYHFQFLAGREGLIAFMPPPENPDNEHSLFSFSGSPGYMKFAFPIFSLTTFHASAESIGLDLVWQLGYDLTYYVQGEGFLAGAREGEVLHGLFLGFAYKARRYFYAF